MMKRKQTKSPMERFTVKDFEKQFPTDDACLEWLKDFLYPDGIHCEKCDKVTPHYKVASRKSYSCQFCGHHVHPTAGTIYHKSSTPLRLWFKAVFLMASTRCGIAAKQLERELGVTYKTAWRMFHQIRSMLDESEGKLSGQVEADETYIGGVAGNMHYHKRKQFKAGRGVKEHKTIVFGVVKREGRVRGRVVADRKMRTLQAEVRENVEIGSTLITDEYQGYENLHNTYDRLTVNHLRRKYVEGIAHTNTIEGFWSLLKGGIRGVYKHVGRDYIQNYVNEYAFRYNRRKDVTPMFVSFLKQARKIH